MKFLRKIKKGLDRCLRCVNGTKGAISLLLAILMVPFVTIAGVLLDAARLNSAVALFDEALCNASNSTLGTYDKFLKKRFGLLAMAQDGDGSYTADQFITETFEFYMEQNGLVLSNTFKNVDVAAAGVYPLADQDVMLSQILEYSKYTVPAKMVVDGFCVEDIINSLTKNLNFATSVLNAVGSGVGLLDSIAQCEDKFNEAITSTEAVGTAETAYTDAYNAFKSSAESYNSAVQTRQDKIEEAQRAVTAAESDESSKRQTYETAKAKVQSVLDQIAALESEKDAEGKPVDNSEEIEKLREDNKEDLEAYETAQSEHQQAVRTLSQKRNDLQQVENTQNRLVNDARLDLVNKKSEYITKIEEMAAAVKSCGDSIVGAQEAAKSVTDNAVGLVEDVCDSANQYQSDKADKDIEALKKQKKDAEEKGETEVVEKLNKDIAEAEEIKRKNENAQKLEDAKDEAAKGAAASLTEFANRQYQQHFTEQYDPLIRLKEKVRDEYIVPGEEQYTTKAPTVDSSYYKEYLAPITKENLEDLLDGIAQGIASSSFIAIIKAIIAFIKALFSLSGLYDGQLDTVIDTSLYDDRGGLPSDRRKDPAYSLKSPYETADSQKSDAYKELLTDYSGNPDLFEKKDVFGTAVESIKNSINKISSEVESDWKWNNFLGKLKRICEEIINIVGQVITLVNNIVRIIAEAIYQKGLLAGYLAYNTANRTTYSGSALTGAGYNLPTNEMGRPAYCFNGCETEYLIIGSYNEVANQSGIFFMIYVIRLLVNLPTIFTNAEVGTIASAAGSATFGIGTVLVYILYVIAEPLMDALILCNSGKVPVVKLKAYLTPGGIMDLIGAFWSLTLSQANKEMVYGKVVGIMGKFSGAEYSENYQDQVDAYKAEHGTTDIDTGLLDQITINYTKSLLLLMIFINTDTLMSRFTNIVEMEAVYNAHYGGIGTYHFNLDTSYTYLRASGSFEATPFMKLADLAGLISSERIVYRGY